MDCARMAESFLYHLIEVVCVRSKDWERNAVSPSHFPGMSQRSPNRNREFNAWSQEHKDNPGVCQDYQGKIEQRRGKVVSANK